MINTIIIVICTVINCAWGLFWIRRLQITYKKIYKVKIRAHHLSMCSQSIEHDICPHDCEKCAWGDVMTERQLNQEKRTKNFYKEIMKYHRRHKNG